MDRKMRGAVSQGDMTRAEFLGVGAAVGSGLYLDTAVRGIAEPTSEGALADAACPELTDCTDNLASDKWHAPDWVVNAFWGVLMPRVAAAVWRGRPSPGVPPDDYGAALVWPIPGADCYEDILVWIEYFVGSNHPMLQCPILDTTPPLTYPAKGTNANLPRPYISCESEELLVNLHNEYRRLDQAGNCVEGARPAFQYLGKGGYDFMLSESGIHFFAPRDIEYDDAGRAEIITDFTYRNTGRAPIALPHIAFYDSAKNHPYYMNAPVSPSQLDSIAPEFLCTLPCAQGDLTAALGFSGTYEGTAEAVRRVDLLRTGRPGLPIDAIRLLSAADVEGPFNPRQVLRHPSLQPLVLAELKRLGNVVGTPGVEDQNDPEVVTGLIYDRLARSYPADLQEWIRRHLPGQVPFELIRDWLTEDEGAASGISLRAWLLERAMALIDFQELLQPPPSQTVSYSAVLCGQQACHCWTVSGSVFRGIQEEFPRVVAKEWDQLKPVGNGTLLRPLITRRLETSLPDPSKMQFEVPAANAPNNLDITNRGFHFPAVDIPRFQDFFVKIINGYAGNPVFTDSRRSE